ncbi:MAG: VCBS repeat-containing protein [Myxococcota bacterium]
MRVLVRNDDLVLPTDATVALTFGAQSGNVVGTVATAAQPAVVPAGAEKALYFAVDIGQGLAPGALTVDATASVVLGDVTGDVVGAAEPLTLLVLTPPAVVAPAVADTGACTRIVYSLRQQEGVPVDVDVEWSRDGQSFQRARMGIESQGIRQMRSTSDGTPHHFTWDAARDLGRNEHPGVTLRLTPRLQGVSGESVAVGPIDLDLRGGQFGPPQGFPVGTQPQRILVDAFAGNGEAYAVVANEGDANFSVMRPDGAGGFFEEALSPYNPGAAVAAVASGDFDGDGLPDLAVATATPDVVRIYRRRPEGYFSSIGNAAISGVAVELHAVDVNRDGILDLVSVASGVNVSIGTGGGAFAAATQWLVGDAPVSVTSGDFDRDGAVDLVAASGPSGTNGMLLLGDGAGSFSGPTRFGASVNVLGIAAGDVDRDAALDVVFVSDTDPVVVVVPGDGAGGFGNQQTLVTTGVPHAFAAVDMDADGWLDIITANRATDDLSVIRGGADGFAFPRSISVPGTALGGIAAARIDGDGAPDLVLTDSLNDQMLVLANINAGECGLAWDGSGSVPNGATLADVTGDGVVDALIPVGTSVYLWRGMSGGTHEWAGSVDFGFTISYGFGIGDLNRDGAPDLVAPDHVSGVIQPALGDGLGGFTLAGSYQAPASFPLGIAVGDLSGDDVDDVAVLNYRDQVVLAPSSEAGVPLGHWEVALQEFGRRTLWQGESSIRVGDMDDDGDLDVVYGTEDNAATPTRQTLHVAFLDWPNQAATELSWSYDAYVGFATGRLLASRPRALAIGVTSANAIVLVDSAGEAPDVVLDAPGAPQSVGMGDLDRDGDDDVIAATRVAGTSWMLSSWENVDGLTFAPRVDHSFNGASGALSILDLNGDAMNDVSVGGVLLTSSPSGLVPPSGNTINDAIGSALTAVADVDRDGRPDLLMAGGASPLLRGLVGDGGGSFIQVSERSLTLTPTRMAVVDLDGDSIDDVILAHATGGVWHRGLGDGSFADELVLPARPDAVEDINQDGALDLITVGGTAAETRLGNGDGTFGTVQTQTITFGTTLLAIARVNGDPYPDVITSNNGSSVKVHFSQANGSLALPFTVQTGTSQVGSFLAADVNGDTRTDLITMDPPSGSVSALYGDGGGGFGAPVACKAVAPYVSLRIHAAQDMDKDGRAEILASGLTVGGLLVLRANGMGAFCQEMYVGSNAFSGATLGDFNRDGRSDLVGITPTGGESFLGK